MNPPAHRSASRRPRIVHIERWTRRLDYEGPAAHRSFPDVVPSSIEDLPEPIARFRADEAATPEATLGEEDRRFEHEIVRIRVRAPSVDGRDLPRGQWATTGLLQQIEQLGLDPEVALYALAAKENKQLRFAGKRAPFWFFDAEGVPIGTATYTTQPLALNYLLEVEHERRFLASNTRGPWDFHVFSPTMDRRSTMLDSRELAAEIALRCLSTVDTATAWMRTECRRLERELVALVSAEEGLGTGEGAVRSTNRDLLNLTVHAGAARDDVIRSQLTMAVTAGHETKPAAARVHVELERHRAELTDIRTELREASRTAADGAQLLTLVEQEAQSKRGAALQQALTIITAAVLLPGLVASIFGANIAVPGKDAAKGSLLLILGMIGTGLITAWLLYALDKTRMHRGFVRPLSQAILLVLAVIALCAAITVAILL